MPQVAHPKHGKFMPQPGTLPDLPLTSKLHANWFIQSLLIRPLLSNQTLPPSLRLVFHHHFQTLVLIPRTMTSQAPQLSLFKTPCSNSLMEHPNVFLMKIGHHAPLLEQHHLTSPLPITIHSRSVLTSVLPVDIP